MSKDSDKTLCALAEEGYIKSNTKDYVKLIRSAKFFCKGCGRSAADSRNLCKPEKLS